MSSILRQKNTQSVRKLLKRKGFCVKIALTLNCNSCPTSEKTVFDDLETKKVSIIIMKFVHDSGGNSCRMNKAP